MPTQIVNGRVWTDGGLNDFSILIGDDGKIAGIGARHAWSNVSDVLDASGQIILPGGVDLHVHMQDGAETFAGGTRAAAAGGITTAVDIAPFHVCCTTRGYQARIEQCQAQAVIDVGLSGGIVVDRDDLKELGEIARLGAAYFKVFMPSTPVVDTALLWACVQTAAHTGLRMALHAEEVNCLLADVDWNDALGFARSRPIVAETSAVAQALEMARAAGAPIHICHVSAGRSAELIDDFRAHGTDVTSETTPHFLLFDENEFLRQGARVKTTPPLRTRADVEQLWQALREGVIDALACDHWLGELPSPETGLAGMREKEAGIAGLEVSLPAIFDAGVSAGRLGLERFVQITARRPAEIAGYKHKGKIAVGADADLILIDPDASWTVHDLGAFSRISTTPYVGRTLRGRISRTLVRGKTIWDGEKITTEPGYGLYVNTGDGND